jgi:F420-0:gamma-glutamyl ligase
VGKLNDHVLLLPDDPDASARNIRNDINAKTGVNVELLSLILLVDPSERGQVNIAIGGRN